MSVSDEIRVERVAKAVLDAEFAEAAAEYADELIENGRTLEVVSLRRLMRKRERFLTLRRMQTATPVSGQ